MKEYQLAIVMVVLKKAMVNDMMTVEQIRKDPKTALEVLNKQEETFIKLTDELVKIHKEMVSEAKVDDTDVVITVEAIEAIPESTHELLKSRDKLIWVLKRQLRDVERIRSS